MGRQWDCRWGERMALRCKGCGGEEYVKTGFMRGKQRYRCKACGLNFTDTPPRGRPLRVKVEAVLLYLSGLSMNRTAELLGVSTPSVQAWIERFAEVYAQRAEARARGPRRRGRARRDVALSRKSPTSSGCGRLGIVLRGGSSTGSRAVGTRPPARVCWNDRSAGASASTVPMIGRPTPS